MPQPETGRDIFLASLAGLLKAATHARLAADRCIADRVGNRLVVCELREVERRIADALRYANLMRDPDFDPARAAAIRQEDGVRPLPAPDGQCQCGLCVADNEPRMEPGTANAASQEAAAGV